MRRLILGLFIASWIPAVAWAQATAEHKGQGYVFFAPGAVSPGGSASAHFGGGGEALVYKGLGVGGEIGYLTPWQSFSSGLGVLSADGSYHFLPRKRDAKVVPFVTGGYTLFFRSGSGNLFNFGGGINYWFRQRVGLRLEFRDHVWPSSYQTEHYWGFRIGLAFR